MNFKEKVMEWVPFGELCLTASFYLSVSFGLVCVILAKVFPQELALILDSAAVVTVVVTAACLIVSLLFWQGLPEDYGDRQAAIDRVWVAATEFRLWNVHRLIVGWVAEEWRHRKWRRSQSKN